jgi:uncharacterized protein YvpB
MDNKWIPVTEELPQEYTYVLVYCAIHEVTLASYEKKKFWIDDGYGYMQIIEATHWMPLPDAPNGEK